MYWPRLIPSISINISESLQPVSANLAYSGLCLVVLRKEETLIEETIGVASRGFGACVSNHNGRSKWKLWIV